MLSNGTYTGQRPEFKEKFVELSEGLFKGSPLYNASIQANTFWDSYLILPVNAKCITRLIQNMSEEALLNLKTYLSRLFLACLEKLELKQDDMLSNNSEKTRQKNAISVLTIVIRNLFSKKRLSHFNIISILTGLDEADALFSRLVKAIQVHIRQPTATRSPVLQLALALSAGSDNVNQNGLNGYFMTNDISQYLFDILSEKDIDENDSRDIIMLLGMLSNYSKYESRNPYLQYMKKCKQGNSLENIIAMYTSTFISLRSRYIQLNDDEETFSQTIVTYMSHWFSSSAPVLPSKAENNESLALLPSAQTALLLPLYDLINTNSYFVNSIVNVCSKISAESKDSGTAQSSNYNNKATFITALLSFASYLFENSRTHRTNMYSRLLLIIILRLMEESAVMNYMAREGSAASVRLCRQRSPQLPLIKTNRSMFAIILDDMLLFVKHNIRNKLDLQSYKFAFSIIHRVLCFISKHKIRIEYHWIELWPTLTSVLHFTALKLDDLKQREEFNLYIASLVSIFNVCVSHGENFLSDTKSYDRLYYEIIRTSADFMKLADYVNNSVAKKSRIIERTPSITVKEFYNIQLICNHFQPALDEWQLHKNIKFPAPEQVMAVINDNYATLELMPMDKLDISVAFTEIPTEMSFFRQLLRVTVFDYLEYYTLSIAP